MINWAISVFGEITRFCANKGGGSLAAEEGAIFLAKRRHFHILYGFELQYR